MKSPLLCVLAAGAAASVANAQIVLNEVYPNPPGGSSSDNAWEYIEIYGPPGMSLTGYLIASVYGGGDPNANNIPGPLPAGWDGGDEVPEIDEAWSLDGRTIGSNGLFVLYNSLASSAVLPMFAPGTNSATFSAAHCPSNDVAGRIKNDGSATFVLVRKRPFHAINASGISVYDGVPANTIVSGPTTYPSAIRYAWRKDVNQDVNFNSRIDFNGTGTLLGGGPHPPETPLNSERAATPAVGAPRTLEPYQMVDDVTWSNGGGKEYARSKQQELSSTLNFNPDAVSRVAYYGANPHRGHVFEAGVMKFTHTADEEFVYGDIVDTGPQSLPLVQYSPPPTVGGPTDPNGPHYNDQGQLDPQGAYLLNDINLAGYRLTPGNFNDVDGTAAGGIVINEFRFLRGDFNFDGVVDCADRALIETGVGAGLDDQIVTTDDNNTDLVASDDFTYTGWKWQGREFNGLLAMVRMSLTDGTTGEWNSGTTVTPADLAAFDAEFSLSCAGPCDPDYNLDGNADQDDVSYLINVIGGGDNPSGRDPDFTGDGNADQDDVTALINTVGGGGCP